MEENKKTMEIYKPKPKNNYTNKIINKIHVLNINHDYSNKQYQKTNKPIPYYDCYCECSSNEIFQISQNSLRTNIKSCKKCRGLNLTIANEYILMDDNKTYFVTASNCQGFYIDKEDYDLIKEYRWYSNKENYIISHDKIKKRQIRLHRFITKCPNNLVVDHIDGNPLNNCRDNLRVCTQLNNIKNRKLTKNNSSGTTGVGYFKKMKMWKSTIMVNGDVKVLGWFENKEDAIYSRLEAESFYYKNFSRNQDNIKNFNIDTSNYKSELELSSNFTNILSKEIGIDVYELDKILNKNNFKIILKQLKK